MSSAVSDKGAGRDFRGGGVGGVGSHGKIFEINIAEELSKNRVLLNHR